VYLQRRIWLTVILVVLLTGCSGWMVSPTPSTTPMPTRTPEPSPVPTEVPVQTPSPDLVALSLWVPDFLDPSSPDGLGSALADSLSVFVAIRSGRQVEVVVKNDSGEGGLYHLLSTAHEAAPAVLPDLIVLNQNDMRVAISEGHVQPLQLAYLNRSDFYGFALEGLEQNGELYGLPLLTTAPHFAYRQGLSDSTPLTWTAVLTGGYSLLFPGGPTGGIADDALMALYLGTGGQLWDEEGRAVLERGHLEELYRFFRALVDGGVLDARQALNLTDSAACYAQFQMGTASLSPVPSIGYWRNPAIDSVPSWAPSVAGEPASLGRTWSVALVTADPLRQSLALELALALVSPNTQAELAVATGMFPSRRSGVQALDSSTENKQFLDALLMSTTKAPLGQTDLALRRALQAGLTLLLTEPTTTPEEAAAYALTSLRQ